MILRILWLVFFMFLFGCSGNVVSMTKKIDLDEEVFIEAKIEEVEIIDRKSTKITGNLIIHGKNIDINFVNLSCVGIEINGSVSDSISIDSFVDYLVSHVKVADNLLNVDVYWIFRNKLIDDEFSDFRIVVDKICLLKDLTTR